MKFTDWPWRYWRDIRSEAPALRLDDETLNWQQLCQRVDVLADGLRRQQVQEGQAVMLRSRNSSQAVLAWLALLQCGVRVLPVNPQLPATLLQELLPSLSLSHMLDLHDSAIDTGLALLRLQPGYQAYTVDWRAERLVSMTFTSGSTGLPKAAVHTAAAHLASASGVLSAIAFQATDCWLLSLPLFHVSGQGILWRWLLAGAQLAVSQRPLSEALSNCSHASLVPLQLWRLLKEPIQLSLKAVLLGGAAIPLALTREASQRGIAIWCSYGLTECASTLCAKLADGYPDVGRPLAGSEVCIVNGEAWLRAPGLASGYWCDGKLLPLVNEQGWFATRDSARMQNGRLLICGRLDNVFFSAGEGIQPEEVERIIANHQGVQQVFVVPIDDVEFGQRPVAVVEYQTGTDGTILAQWVSDKLARFAQPVRWLTLPDALKTDGIKISRRAVQQWVSQSHRR